MSPLLARAIPVFLALQLVELLVVARVRHRRPLRGYELRDSVVGMSLGAGYLVLGALLHGAVFASYAWLGSFAPFHLGSAPWVWLLLFVGDDLCFYANHRANHRVALLWATHTTHHSGRRFNLSTALRQSWTAPIADPIFWGPLALLGFDPEMMLSVRAMNLLYQFCLHTELVGHLGPLEWLFNTPSHHRAHHGRNARYVDCNFGGVLIVWDRLLGTFVPEAPGVDFGLPQSIRSYNPVRVTLHGWMELGRALRAASTFGERLRTALRPPG